MTEHPSSISHQRYCNCCCCCCPLCTNY